MSRYGGPRASTGNLPYDEAPERWDRERFERFRRAPDERETFRFSERDRPGRTDVRVEDHVDRRTARGGRFEEDDFFERKERYGPPARVRRSDRELFGDYDPREIVDRQLQPYRKVVERDVEVRRERVAPPRPGMMRRQSSLDTFDRRPMPRYSEREDYRLPPNVPIPLPRERRRFVEEDFEEIRYRDAQPQAYREVEIEREREVRRPQRSSRAKSVSASTNRSSSSESFEKISRASSPSPARVGRRGKTRMPKRLVKKQAVIDLGYPFEEEVRLRSLRFWI